MIRLSKQLVLLGCASCSNKWVGMSKAHWFEYSTCSCKRVASQTWRPTQYVVAPVHVETDMPGPGCARSGLTHAMFESYSILAMACTLVALVHLTPWMRCSSFCARTERSSCFSPRENNMGHMPNLCFPINVLHSWWKRCARIMHGHAPPCYRTMFVLDVCSICVSCRSRLAHMLCVRIYIYI